jgi:hypothetical protein
LTTIATRAQQIKKSRPGQMPQLSQTLSTQVETDIACNGPMPISLVQTLAISDFSTKYSIRNESSEIFKCWCENNGKDDF